MTLDIHRNKHVELGQMRLRTFDFLRGLAILGVITSHASLNFPSEVGVLDFIFRLGRFGVQLFFLVSALTMCHMWKQREDEVNPIFNFYIRRFCRIAPLFWLSIPIYLLINGTGPSYFAPEGISFREIILTISFLHGFWPSSISSVVPGGWSIAVEMTFYLIFPLLALTIKNRSLAYLIGGFLLYLFNVLVFQDYASNFLSANYITDSTSIIKDYLYLNFINQSPIFLLGCFIFFKQNISFTKLDFLIGLLWIVAPVFLGIPVKNGIGFVSVYFCLGCFVIFCLKFSAKNYLIEKLGENSYAIYLSHFSVLSLLHFLIPFFHGILSFFVGLVLTIFFSYIISVILNKLVEKPVRNLANYLTRCSEKKPMICNGQI